MSIVSVLTASDIMSLSDAEETVSTKERLVRFGDKEAAAYKWELTRISVLDAFEDRCLRGPRSG